MTRAKTSSTTELKAFVARLHFYAGLFVGPFLLVAAITGVLYVLTPQIEDMLYRPVLQTNSDGPTQSLVAQFEAARAVVGPDLRLAAIRPATGPGRTTRVMFADPTLGESQNRAIFVDPVTLAVTGDLTVYGTSGILPFRTALDHLHRNLMLGDLGRYYSELAASWLWIMTLGGILLWLWRRTGRLSRQNPRNGRLRTRRLHGLIGVGVSLGLLFLSATGLTWSQGAGGRIDALRGALGWVTPSVSLALDDTAPAGHPAGGDHAHHHAESTAMAPVPDAAAQLDGVLAAARSAGLASPLTEIRPPRPGQAWLVREYDRSWPTRVDSVAIDPRSMQVTGRAEFASFPLVAKLIRWGIDMHMGALFGVANQMLMAAAGLGLVVATLYGYRIWWQQRPAAGAMPQPLVQSWLRLSAPARLGVALVAALLGWALPALGFSLVAFLGVDAARWVLARSRARPLPAE
jgi:uncharacterized iron-regulated membrane protein